MANRISKKVFIGFDGSVDSTVRPIKTSGKVNEYFATIGEYGGYIASKAGLSCSIQTVQLESHSGGNAPFVSAALNSMGFDVCLAGMLGEGHILPEFRTLENEGVRLFTFAAPSFTRCFEFDDGKILMADQIPSLGHPFENLLEAMGEEAKAIADSDLAAFLNWGEYPWMQGMWEQAVDYIAKRGADRNKLLFFDLADISCRSFEDTEKLLTLLKKASSLRHTVLSMNENEMLTLGRNAFEGLSGEKLLERLCIEGYSSETVLHTLYMSTAFDGTFHSLPTDHVAKPLISTGAGDNFNAGYCAAAVMGLDADKRLECANTSAYIYLTTGRPMTTQQLNQI